MSVFALPGESRPGIIRVKVNEKTSINSIYLNLQAPTAGPFQGSTVMQIKFRNVCEVKKRLVVPRLVWSRTLSILLSLNGENVCLHVFTYWANTSSNFTAGS